jgi:hypothetical protein
MMLRHDLIMSVKELLKLRLTAGEIASRLHENFDYQIGETRVVCNPRGYIGHEEIADNFKLKVVEV